MDLVKIRRKALEDRLRREAADVQVPPPASALLPSAPATIHAIAPPIPVGSPAPLEAPRPAPVPLPTSALPDNAPAHATDPQFLELAGEALVREARDLEPEAPSLLLCFLLAAEEYALNILEVKEIIKPRDITEVPRLPDYVLGIISLRGVVVPVIDLRRRLGLDAKPVTRSTRIIVASDDVKTVGMMVDEVTQVARIPANRIEPPPLVIGAVEAEYILGVGRDNGRMVILLNLPRIFLIEPAIRSEPDRGEVAPSP